MQTKKRILYYEDAKMYKIDRKTYIVKIQIYTVDCTLLFNPDLSLLADVIQYSFQLRIFAYVNMTNYFLVYVILRVMGFRYKIHWWLTSLSALMMRISTVINPLLYNLSSRY